jgi:hypothetical protein
MEVLDYLSEEFKNDYDIVKIAVEYYHRNLKYAGPKMKNNKERQYQRQ